MNFIYIYLQNKQNTLLITNLFANITIILHIPHKADVNVIIKIFSLQQHTLLFHNADPQCHRVVYCTRPFTTSVNLMLLCPS